MSRPDGRRGRRKPDPAEETAIWLLELEQVARGDESDEEDWAETLRATRRDATGQFPAVPVEGPGGAAAQPAPAPRPPPEPAVSDTGSWFASELPTEPATGHGAESWAGAPPPAPVPPPAPGAAWETADPAPTLYAQPNPYGQEDPYAQRDPYGQPLAGMPEPQLGAGAPWPRADLPRAEPSPQEPPVWDTLAEPEPWSGNWPFEEASQSWEADDRSYTWPVQELPANTGSWEAPSWEAPSEPSWRRQEDPRQEDPWGPAAPPRFEAEPTVDPIREPTGGYRPDPGGYPVPESYPVPGTAGAYPAGGGRQPEAGYPAPAADPYGAASYVPQAPQPAEPPPPMGPQIPEQFTRVLEDEEEQVVRLGRAAGAPAGGPAGRPDTGPRVQAGRTLRAGEARRLDDDVAGRSRWPRVVALISWIILLMVLCWFYFFPWLERILPENF